jgi:ubiquinone/menaquinone biosynthesis C-methylase UbiE
MSVSTNEQSRINWVAQELKKIPEGLTILDAGAGEQQYKKYCSHLNYVSQDFAAYSPTSDHHGLQMGAWDYGKLDIVSDIVNIPKPDNTFDAILCTEVFEHIPDPTAAVKEFSRLLKPGGILIVTAPFCSMTHFAPYHFSTGFNRYFYETHLSLHGFSINSITPNGNYFSYMAQEINRMPHVAINYGLSKINFLGKLAISYLHKCLVKWASSDDQSSELMCFGYHVVAVKNH